MQHEIRHGASVRRIAGKELTLFFSSPIAYLFLATFAAVTLFVFFWGEAFFARNIADVRPLFEWMPILLVFLASTLTMRLWSEERRGGTLEYVLTRPMPLWHFVVGKFLACLVLLLLALAITLPLPITVSLLGDLDWGPVWAGYLATFLLGGAYLSIGLFVSSRSDNQIVSLITATALCGLLYLLGTPLVTDFFGTRSAEWLRLLGTGSRFESITRGVIDLRDLYYYLSIMAAFLVLNTYVLERERWAQGSQSTRHGRWHGLALLLVANALAGNLWLGQLGGLRVDATEGRQYSISDATRSYLGQLREPLLLRAYFSGKTHPLLAPLAPQLRDLLREYEIAGDGRVRVEVVDPADDPELEQQANQTYGIRPVPFQVADRYQASIVSSYFDLLVKYGDQYEVLGFRDLIEVRSGGEMDLDVQLRNPEHDITRAVRKVLHAYQAGGNLFDTVAQDLAFTAYVSPDPQLPEDLRAFRAEVAEVVEELAAGSGGRLSARFLDPDAGKGELRQQIAAEFGFQPMTTSLLSNDRFYFYLTLAAGDTVVQIPLDDMTEASFRRNLEAGIKRFAAGFTRTVAMVAPQQNPMAAQYGMPAGPGFSQLRNSLAEELNVVDEDLSDGSVSGEADVLLLLAPENLDDRQLFAVDQFLMQGGTVIVASSPFISSLDQGGLSLRPLSSGLSGWLAHHGFELDSSLVMDPQNAAFPLPVTRNVGGFQLQEVAMLDYPWFVDVRPDGLNRELSVTADLPQLTLAWASPITLADAPEGAASRSFTALAYSSADAWLSASTEVMPRIDADGLPDYRPEGERGRQLLAAIGAGRFDSYFAGRESPLLQSEPAAADNGEAGENDAAAETPGTASAVIQRSPESARLMLIGSNDFLRDQVLGLAGAAGGSEYLNSLQFMANAVDWALQDDQLASIRSRGHFNRTLPPMEQDAQVFWEYLNYGLAALALLIIAAIQHLRRRRRLAGYAALMES